MLLLVACLTAISVGSLSAFFMHLYRKDKVATLYQREKENLARNASALENLVNLARIIDTEYVRSSQELILLVEHPCRNSNVPVHTLSERYATHLKQLELTPEDWSGSLDVYQACQESRREIAGDAPLLRILPTRVQLMVPYLTVFFRQKSQERLALITMDGLRTLPGSTLFLMDRAANLQWSVDGEEFLKSAFEDTGLTRPTLISIFEGMATLRKGSQIADIGKDGLLSYAPIGPEWILASLTFKPTLLAPLGYAFRQFLILTLALSCLVMVIGRFLSSQIVKPLKELQLQAEEIGAGRFEVKFEESKAQDEIASVKRAFNTMGDRLTVLMEERKKAAAIESELLLAKGVQNLLLPPAQIRLERENIYSFVQSASQCGGDWWGCLAVPRPGSTPLSVLMIGDATDHGVPSALLTAVVRGAVSVYSQWAEQNPDALSDPSTILNRLNQAIMEAAKGSMSMTFQVITLDPIAQKLYCANAGHLPAYLISPEGKIQAAGAASIPLGSEADTKYNSIQTFQWVPGSKLVMYSDGLIDAMEGNSNRFDRKTFRKIIAAHSNLPGRSLLNKILETRNQTAGHITQVDDITLLVCDAV